MKRYKLVSAVLGAVLLGTIALGTAAAKGNEVKFDLVRSATAETAGCLTDARGEVTIRSIGPVEVMDVDVKGLPKKTEFDLFVTQLPNGPFGVSWYQGDLETNGDGHGHQRYVGRFSVETFAVAPGSGPVPQVHPNDATANNPAFLPIHTYHLGLWFNSPDDAKAANCPPNVTPFNGDHTAGVQAMSTKQYPPTAGPLRQVGS